MSSRKAVIAPGVKASFLILLIIGLLLGVRSLASGLSPLAQIYAATQRISAIALDERSGVPWLLLICIAAGLVLISERRRRARVRQATS